MSDGVQPAPGLWKSILTICASRRLAAVALLSFSSGLPLGLVWTAIPAWMKTAGVDIKVIGLFTLAQAPWSFKFLWSPLMDRYPPPFLGRKRGWIFLSQIGLLLTGLWLAGVADHPEAVWVIGALALGIGLIAATQDIAYDAYAVEVLRTEEHGLAVGARTALYRVAMLFSGSLSITLAATFDVDLLGHHFFTWHGSWALVNLVLALAYLPVLWVTWKAPDPESPPEPPRSLKDAVWLPFLELLGQHRALEILAFVVLFKLSDNLTQALLRPFFIEMGFGPVDVGVATGTIGMLGAVGGALLGGLLTSRVGLGRALWITGLLQMLSNLGYAVLAHVGPSRPLLYSAQAFEYLTGGLGTAAFGVLLLRLTERRFSATQFALLSSLFSIPRVLAGPPAGLLVDAIGWRDFFILTVLAGVPGLFMLGRFVPWREREPRFHVEAARRGAPLTRRQLGVRTGIALVGAWIVSWVTVAALAATADFRAGHGFDFSAQAVRLVWPASLGDGLTIAGIILVAACVALGSAALWVARRGVLAPGRQEE
jgi:MFS transporter, PAT family, beta-lactamase induction signal transducer AmpG